jgi:hypothetical protein
MAKDEETAEGGKKEVGKVRRLEGVEKSKTEGWGDWEVWKGECGRNWKDERPTSNVQHRMLNQRAHRAWRIA